MNQVDVARWSSVQGECRLHIGRLKHALSRIEHLLPLTVEREANLSEDEISFFDQLVYRFLKLQDTMGGKLFPWALKLLGENYDSKPFIDVLNRLERLSLIPSREEWVRWRELRNDLTHEYPDSVEDRIDAINKLQNVADQFADVYSGIVVYVDRHCGFDTND